MQKTSALIEGITHQLNIHIDEKVMEVFSKDCNLQEIKFRITAKEETAGHLEIEIDRFEFLPEKDKYVGDDLVIMLMRLKALLYTVYGAKVVSYKRCNYIG